MPEPALNRAAPRPTLLWSAGLALALLLGAACASEPQRTQFDVTFTANADDPLPGVEVGLDGGRLLGKTGADGTLRVKLAGREGTPVKFRVHCPDGYREPREVPTLTLRRFTGLDPRVSSRGIAVSLECPPTTHLAALVVRTHQSDLPVLVHGREIARTDADGVANALLTMTPNSTFRVVIDTQDAPHLRPESPATTLTLPDDDQIFLVDQQFTVEAPPPPPHPVHHHRVRHRRHKKPQKPGPTGPERLK